nr:DNA fragmentation factor subunit beta isoform X2 [Halyomorpha halys]
MGYKVTDATRTKTCGIACSTLKELKAKACLKFNVKNADEYYFSLLDGTIVDSEDYFSSLPPQILLIFSKPTDNVLMGADIIYNAFKAVNIEFLRTGQMVKGFFDENVKEKVRILANYLLKSGDAEDNTLKSSRKDDPKWFEGLETNYTSKEAFLRRRCKDRISGYFYKAKSDLLKSQTNLTEKKLTEILLNRLKGQLRKCDFNGGYFDRKDNACLCDESGFFKCSGAWNKEKCLYLKSRRHIINPYASREERIVFSTWNLDHRIEKSRTIIPSIEKAVKSVAKDGSCHDLNYDLIFSLLFTSENLRLVHIVCHDKGAHSTATLEPEKFLLKRCNGIKKDKG